MKEKITVQIKYLSSMRDRIGHRDDTVSFPGGATLEDLKVWLNTNWSLSLPDPKIILTLNGRGWSQLSKKLSTELREGDVICIFPTISGG